MSHPEKNQRLKIVLPGLIQLSLALLMLVPTPAKAANLGSFSVTDLGSGDYGFYDHIGFQLAMSSAAYPGQPPYYSCTFPPGPSCPVLFTVLFTPADAGSSFHFDGNNSALPLAQTLLTNGQNNAIWSYFYAGSPASGLGAGYLDAEAAAFYPSGGGPDFFGFQITGFRLQVNSASITHGPINGLPGTEFASGVTVFVEGVQMPEPSTWTLLATALTLLFVMRAYKSQTAIDRL